MCLDGKSVTAVCQRLSCFNLIETDESTAIAYLAGTIIQGLVILNNPDYNPHPWQSTLMIWAVLTFSILFNTFFASKLPLLEGVVLVLHILGFFAILVSTCNPLQGLALLRRH